MDTARQVVQAEDTLVRDLEALRGRALFFGHHSVGRDILDGVAELAAETRVPVVIDEGPVGHNQRPLDKFKDFERQVLARRDEVVAMKLCFVDFRPDTHVDALVAAYLETVARIRAARPDVTILHITPALTAREMHLRARINRFLGRQVWEDDANLRRLEFSERVRAAFPRDPFLDLGAVESTRPDGAREMHLVGTRLVPMMWPGYTDDGGHLNALGRRWAAQAFVRAFAEASRLSARTAARAGTDRAASAAAP